MRTIASLGISVLALAAPAGCVVPVDQARCAGESGALADACWMATLEDTAVVNGAGAVLHCRHISDVASRDHCYVAAATTMDLPLPQARPVCDAIEDRSWREECHFQVLEHNATMLDPRSYVRACRQDAGRYVASCIDHGLCYWAQSVLDPAGHHWFHPGELHAQLHAVERAGAGSPAFRGLSDGLKWRAGMGRIGRGAEVCGGALAQDLPSHWMDEDGPRWW